MTADISRFDTAQRGHHPDSPSSLQPSAACSHFVNHQRETDASAAGTLQHKAAETRDLSILEDLDQIEAVKRCLAIEDGWVARLTALDFAVTVVREKYLAVCPREHITDEHGRVWDGITGGYPDTQLVAYNPTSKQRLLVILDWKFGKHLVTPTRDNLQGMAYSLAALQEYEDATECVVVFYHPHIEGDEQKPEYQHVFTRADMAEMELRIRNVIARKRRAQREGWASDIKPCPSTNLCLFCDYVDKASCPAVAQLALVSSAKYEPLSVPDEVRPSYLTDPAHMKDAYRISGVIEKLAKQIRKRVTDAVITEGVVIDGMQVVTKSDREVQSVEAVAEAAAEFGVDKSDFTECLSLPITKVETLVKAKAPKGKGAALVREFQKALEERGAVKKGKPYSYLIESKEDAIEV